MILGRFAVRKQAPEWVGAPQKRFAWAVGWSLAVIMLYLIVLNNVIGPINLIVCATCLTLMFFESAFGICLACKVYNLFFRQQARHCPGGVCVADQRLGDRKLGFIHAAIVAGFVGTIALVGERYFPPTEAIAAAAPNPVAAANDGKCAPPDWAVAMGHAEMWKLHNNCK